MCILVNTSMHRKGNSTRSTITFPTTILRSSILLRNILLRNTYTFIS